MERGIRIYPSVDPVSGGVDMKFIPGFGSALRSALRWRPLLLWCLITLLATEVVTFPVGLALSSRLDHSVHATAFAQHLKALMSFDLIEAGQAEFGTAFGSGAVAALFLLLLIPFLNGVFVAVSRAVTPIKLGELIREGLRNYGPMFRMTLMSVVPLGIAGVAYWGAMKGVKHYDQTAILEADVDHLMWAALALSVVVFAWANASVDAGRASLALDPARRSAIKAWWRGLKLVAGHPLRSLTLYLSITAIAVLVMVAMTWFRIDISATSRWGAFAALLVTQMIVAVTAWMHYARLFAMLELTRSLSRR